MTLVLLAALAACDTGIGTRADEPVPARAPLTGVRWTIDSVTADAERTGVPDRAHFTIDAEGGVTGDLGCNQFRGGAAVSGSTITFDGIETTKTACPTPQAKLERTLLGILDGRTTYRIDGRTLTLTSANGGLLGATAPESDE